MRSRVRFPDRWRCLSCLVALLLVSTIGIGLNPAAGFLSWGSVSSGFPPRIDGNVAAEEWKGAEAIVIPYANVWAQSDDTNFYLLLDFFSDTHEDFIGDSFALYFDLDNNGRVTPKIDLVYNPKDGGVTLSYYLSETSIDRGRLSPKSQLGAGFGTSSKLDYTYPKYSFPHRIWELAISLDELGLGVGDRIGFGVKVASKNPRISYGDMFDFSHLTYGKLVAARRFAVIGELDWMETSDLIRGSDEYIRSRSVALLKVPGGEWCTGFLVAKDILWTATHCLGDLSRAALDKLEAIFNWEKGKSKEEREAFICDEILASWPEPSGMWGENDWGVTLLKCQSGPINSGYLQAPGDKWGVLQLCDDEIRSREPLYLIHQNECWGSSPQCEVGKKLTNPNANPNKKISFGVIADPNFTHYLFSHDADTLGGSSGAPAFDPQSGYVIGYHRGYVKGKDLNVATTIDQIRPTLETEGLWISISHCRK